MITYQGYDHLSEEFLTKVTDEVARLLAISEPRSGDIIRFPNGHLSTLYINRGLQQAGNLGCSRFLNMGGSIGVSGGVCDLYAPEIPIGTDITSLLRMTQETKDMSTWTFVRVPESFYFKRPYRVWDIELPSDKSSEEIGK